MRFLLGDLERVRLRDRVPLLLAVRERVTDRDADAGAAARDLEGVPAAGRDGERLRVGLPLPLRVAAALGDAGPVALDEVAPV